MALEILQTIYDGNRKPLPAQLAKLRQNEIKHNLPPLSGSIALSAYVLWLYYGEYPNDKEKERLERAVDSISKKVLTRCKTELEKSPGHPTYLFIKGSVLGFRALSHSSDNIFSAIKDGWSAIRILENAYRSDPDYKDAALGPGIFQTALSSSNWLVKLTTKLSGQSISRKQGIEYLRACAYQGHYARTLGKIFLTRYLSPYDSTEIAEKRKAYHYLEKQFPGNAMFTFWKNDEYLSFHPHLFYSKENQQELKNKLQNFRIQSYQDVRSVNLVKMQYSLIAPESVHEYPFPKKFHYREFNFYPAYIEALRIKKQWLQTRPESSQAKTLAQSLKQMRKITHQKLDDSPMVQTRKNLFHWHIKDGLKMDPKTKQDERHKN